MATTFLPVLAFNAMEMVFAAIGVLVLIGNWMAKRAKENKANQQLQARSTPNLTLEQMAQRRREQLRLQSGQAGTPPTAAGPQAGQAKTLYERRAEALRRARAQQGGGQSGGAAQDLQTQRREQAEQRARDYRDGERRAQVEAEAKRRLELQQQREKQRQRKAAERQRQQDRLAELEKHRPASHRHTSTPAERARTHALADRPTATETRRRVVDADSSAYDARMSTRPTWVAEAMSGRESLRRAIVLAEVLGKPVALREPNDSTI